MGHLSHTINNLHLDCFETSTSLRPATLLHEQLRVDLPFAYTCFRISRFGSSVSIIQVHVRSY